MTALATAAASSTKCDKYGLEEDLAFRATARRNKLAGLWAADLQGLSGPEAEEFALEVVSVGARVRGEDGLIEKLHDTLKAFEVGPEEIRDKIDALKETAWTDIYRRNAPPKLTQTG